MGERVVDVEAGGRSGTAVTLLAVQGDDDCRDAKRVHEASSHDADDAAMPCFARHDHTLLGRISVELDHLRARFFRGAVGECLALLVLRLDVLKQAQGLFRGFRGQEAEREVGHPEAPRRVEPGRKTKGHITRRELGRLRDLGGLPQRDEGRPRVRRADVLQARSHQSPVVSSQRRKVGDRANGDQVEPCP